MSDAHRIGKYDLIALIARGGMGDVYLARTGGLGGFHKLVVVKTLKPELAEDEKFRSMFLDEAKLAARLNHRNVVQTNDVGEADGTYFLIMEYLDGRSLAVLSKRAENVGEPLSLAFRVRVIADMLAGLHHAHEAVDYDGNRLGVVHRDVCPANVLVTFDGQVRVVDFGVAKTKNQAQETQAGTIKGRVAYMSPEHVSGRGLDHRADVFSAGIMLWEALTKQRFWGGRPEAELLGALVRGELPQLPDDPTFPPELVVACRRALALLPEERFETAHTMRMALEQWLASEADRDPIETWKPKIAGWFSRERAHVAKLIEASTSTGRTLSDLPVLEAALSASSLPASYSGASASRSRSRTPAPSTLSSPASSAPPAHEAARRSAGPVWIALGALGVAAIAGGVVWKLSSKPAEELAAAPVVAAVASANLRVEIEPLRAQLFVDDVAVGNPFSRAFAIGSSHQIRALADGFAPKTEHVELGESTQLRFQLEPLPQAAAPATARPTAAPGAGSRTPPSRAAAATPPAAQPQQPPSAKPPPRGVDSNNPYGRSDAPTPPSRPIDPANPYGK